MSAYSDACRSVRVQFPTLSLTLSSCPLLLLELLGGNVLTNRRHLIVFRLVRAIGILLPMLALAACGGNGSDGGNSGNSPPSANAGADSTVFEGSLVDLTGSGSDPDGDALTLTWSQNAGQVVAINNANQAAANFTAPDVAAGAPETLTFQLRVDDGFAESTDIVQVMIEENVSPTANAGPDRNVIEATLVTIDGSASSDPNTIDTLSFSWAQVGGTPVSLSGIATAQATFTAPDVAPGNVEVLNFQLVVSDGVNNDVDTVTITVAAGQNLVTISGTVNYEFVEPFPNCSQLDFGNIETRPIRRATVQLIDANSNGVIDSTTSDDLGNYQFTDVAALTDVRLRVRAELKRQGSPNWDVEVRDNVDIVPPTPALQDRPLYVVDGGDFNTGGADLIRNLTAVTGWDGFSYSAPRAAAPFAILDTIYSAMQLVLSADPNASFGPLDAFWNVNNTRVQGDFDIDAGELSGAFYTGNPDGGAANPSLFLTGDVNVDTSEFDDDVVVHEWGHYFEDNFSRSDSIGGPHSLGESLDARLAWGEGWATALAAMVLGPVACNTAAVGFPGGFGFNNESGGFGVQGWYNEISVATFLYDLFDTNNDGPDNDSIGFQPIFDTMVGPQVSTESFTTVFSFAAELRPMLNAQQQAFLDAQLTRENINAAGLDIWGSTETNDAGTNYPLDVLPLYVDLLADGNPIEICTNSDFEFESGSPPVPERTGNKLGEDRYVRLSVPATDTYDVLVSTTTATPVTPDPDDRDQSDPDIFIYRDGQLVSFGVSADDNVESFTTFSALLAGEIYSVYVEEFRFEDADGAPDSYPEQICFDVSFTATP